MTDWDGFIRDHGVGEYVRVRYLDPLAKRPSNPGWLDRDLAENIRRFGPSKYVAGLRERMTQHLQGGKFVERRGLAQPAASPPEPHSWPCDDPYCQPCEDAMKRLLRDVGVLPRRGRK